MGSTRSYSSSADARLSVIGLGKLGFVVAACVGSRGFRVVGLDSAAPIIEAIRRGTAPIYEPRLDEVLRACEGRFTGTQDYAELVRHSDVTLVLVPTPSATDGAYVLDHVLDVCTRLGRELREKKSYHLVVLNSTVLPGDMDRHVRPALEYTSGKQCGKHFGLCYNPEFVAIGSVVRDFLNPDVVLIGESDSDAGDMLAGIMAKVCQNDPFVARMNFVNAELTKLALNTYVTMKITFANLLAEVCERLPGADVDVVTRALGRDTRVGSRYLKGGVGYGGPCFPRDNAALSILARRLGTEFPLAEATDTANRRQVHRLAAMVRRLRPTGGRVALLGISYKPNTNVVEESQGLQLAQLLSGEGIPVTVYDPRAMEAARAVLHGHVRYAESLDDSLRDADVLIITTAWDEFRGLDPDRLNGTAVIDCWGVLQAAFAGALGGQYFMLGKGPAGSADGDGAAVPRSA